MINLPDDVRQGDPAIEPSPQNSASPNPVDQVEATSPAQADPAAGPPDTGARATEPRIRGDGKSTPGIKRELRRTIERYRIKRINSLISTRNTLRRVLRHLDFVLPHGDVKDRSAHEELRLEYASVSLTLMVQLANFARERGCDRWEDFRFICQGNQYGVEWDPVENEFRPSCLPVTSTVVVEGMK